MSMGDTGQRPSRETAMWPSLIAAQARWARLLVLGWSLAVEYRALRRFLAGNADPVTPQRCVARLIDLGPTFVKLGQILSTRPDLLPDAYIEALSSLQEHGRPMPADAPRAIVEANLGQSISTLFASFESEPVACASLAQVHRAKLPDGTAVAVKVQRPDIDRLIIRDLDAIDMGLRLVAHLAPRHVARTNVLAFFDEFRRYTLRELDFANEGHVIERFRDNFSGQPGVRFPLVYWSHTARGVLTMGWIDGMRLREASQVLNDDARNQLVRRLIDVMMKMFVSDGLFHADLHPGNILFHEDGSFTLLDFGMYGELSRRQRDRFILYWFAVVQRQLRRAFYHFKAQTHTSPGANERAFFEHFKSLSERFYTSSLVQMSITRVYLEMIKAGYRYGYVFPSELMLHAKALTTAEALLFVLAPTARFEDISRPAIVREFMRRTTHADQIGQRFSQFIPELLLTGELLPANAIDDDWDRVSTREVLAECLTSLGAVLRSELDHAALWRVFLEPHARVVLGAVFSGASLDAVLDDTWARYYELEPKESMQSNVGAVFTTHLAVATLAMHQTLLRHGVDLARSHALLHEIGWRFYTRMGSVPDLLASAFTRDPVKRLELSTRLFRTFPFGAPGYAWRDVPTHDGSVAFDCTKCPVAEYFAHHDASALCVETWCKLDFLLAAQWGGRLVTTGTIASGASRCDFRWYPDQKA
ncbi:AarF/UbiB family protein [Paraburkholderia aromaticivorans]|uniref:AarF/UbiB family protein n=1 Tax=Paraburkholderia aromaticivorans TaxID=2026199 RepID=UPI0038B9E888